MNKNTQKSDWKVSRFGYRKFIAGLLTFLFALNQGIPVSSAITALEHEALTQAPTKSLEEAAQNAETQSPSIAPASQTSQDFLQEDLVLIPVENEEEKEVAAESTVEEAVIEAESAEKNSFEEALNYISQAKDFAVAVVKKITAENLVTLAKQAWESAVAVVKGVIVIFTSHQSDEIRVASGFKKLLDSAATYLNHFQVAKENTSAQEDPSYVDLENAYNEEHVASIQDGELVARTYGNSTGIDPTRYDASYLISKIEQTYDPSLSNLDAIIEVIEAKEIKTDSLELFRSDPPTVFSGEPVLSSFASTSPVATISNTQSSASFFRMDYNLTNVGSYAGSIINWGAKGTFVDLSGLSKISFELRTNNICTSSNCVKIEVEDTSNRRASVFLTGLDSTFKQVDILKTTLQASNPSLDFTRIRQINFVVDSNMTNPDLGFIEVKTGGLDYLPTVPGAIYAQGSITTLPGTPNLFSNSLSAGGAVNGTISLSQSSPRDFSFNYTLADADDFVYTAVNLNGNQNVGTSIVFAATIPAGKTLKVEVKDSANKVADFLLTGTGSKQNYTLSLTGDNIPVGFNTAQVKEMVLVADLSKMGAAGTVTVETNGLNYVPSVPGTVYVQANLTNIPGNPVVNSAAGTAGGVVNGTVAVNQTSPRDFSFNYTLADADDFVFVVIDPAAHQTLASNLVMALTIPAGKKLKVEVKDSSNRVADFTLTGTGAKQNYTLDLSGDNIPAGFALNSISEIVLVADLAAMGASGTVVVETSGLDYAGFISGTPYVQANLTTIPGNPVVNGTSGTTGATANGTVTVIQTSPRDFSFNYTLADADDFVFVSIDPAAHQTLANSLVLALTIPAGKKLRVEVKDSGNRVADFTLNGTGAKQNYTLDLTGDNIPVGFTLNSISEIVLVANLATMGASGTVAVETKGLDFTPAAVSSAYVQANLTTIPGLPTVAGTAGSAGGTVNGTVAVNQTSPRDFSVTYTLADADDFVFVVIDPAANQVLANSLVLALTIPTGKTLKVEVKDSGNRVADFTLLGTGAKQNYTLDLTGDNIPAGFDLNAISEIVLVANLAAMGASGTVVVETKGLDFIPTVAGATYSQAALTALTGNPTLNSYSATAGGTVNGTVAVTQTGVNDFSVAYTAVDADDFSVVNMDFSTVQNLGNPIVLALNIPAGKTLKLEVRDATLKVADFYLTGTGSKQNYSLDLSGDNVPAGFNAAQVKMISFITDFVKMGTNGTFAVETKGLDFIANINGTNFDATVHSILPNFPTLSANGGKVDAADAFPGLGTIVSQNSPNEFVFSYDLNGGATNFAFATIDVPGVNGGALPASFVIGANGVNGAKLRINIKDVTGKLADYTLNLVGSLKNYTLDLTGDNIPAGFDRTKIDSIEFVVDRNLVGLTGNINSVDIRVKALDYAPVLSGVAFDANTNTALPNLPSVSANGGKVLAADPFPGVGTIVSQNSPNEFLFNYNLNGGTSNFAYATIDIPGVNGGTLPSNLILGVNGAAGAKVRVKVVDTTGKIADFVLTLNGSLQNYLLDLTGNNIPAGFDLTKIDFIEFVVDRSLVGFTGNANNLDIRVKALDYAPVVSGIAFDATTHTSLPNLPSVSANGGKVDAADLFPGVGTIVSQNSPDEFLFNYNLNGGATNFAYATIDIPGVNGGTLPASLVLGINGAAGAKARVKVVDTTGKIADFVVSLTGSLQNYVLDLSGNNIPAGFDLTKIDFIEFVVDRSLVGFTGNANNLDIRVKALDYAPVVSGILFDAATHTTLPNLPSVSANGGKTLAADPFPGVGTIVSQNSPNEFLFNYNLNGGTSNFAFATIDIPGTNGGTLPASLVLGINGAAGAKVRVKVVDTTGKIADFVVSLTGSLQNYVLDLSGNNIPAGFDLTKIDFIEFVVDRSLVGFTGNANNLDIRVKALDYAPSLTGVPFDANVHTVLPNLPTVSANGGKVDAADLFPGVGTIVAQNSPNEFLFNYNLNGGATNFAYATIDIPGTNGGTLPSNLILGINGAAGAKVRVKVVDTTGKIADFVVTLSGSLQNYLLDLSGNNIPAGFDLTKVDFIEFVVDRNLVGFTGNTNNLDIRVKGLDFTPVVDGAVFSEAGLTVLTNNPTVSVSGTNSVAGQPNAIATLQQTSTADFTFEYDVRPSASSFAFANIVNGGFDINGVFQGVSVNLPQNFVIAARGRKDAVLKVVLLDINNKKADFLIKVDTFFENYTLDLSGNNIDAGFDRTKVAQILIVADRNTTGSFQNDLVHVKIPGLNYSPSVLPSDLEAVKASLVQKGLSFFQTSTGLDPVTHFPYDSVEQNGLPLASEKFTQPTSIGYYLQILGDQVKGKITGGLTVDQALTEMDTVVSSLLTAQASFGWNGLLPWMSLDPTLAPYNNVIGIGDNANLAQSIAVAVGALQTSTLTPAQQAAAAALIAKAEQFLDNQEPGYVAAVDPTFGILRLAFNRTTPTSTTGSFDSYMDRIASEFRGAIAFIAARYNATVPSTVFSNLAVVTADYTDVNGNAIKNLAYYDGGAFQAFWPGLRNNEREFVGFRNALYNALATFGDYSAQNNLPGFVSASQRPNGVVAGNYYGRIGIRQIAESGTSHADQFVQDVASTYALASAMGVDSQYVLNWLNTIEDSTPGLLSNQGFFDSARSNSEISRRVIAVDVASTILGLVGAGPDSFDAYMKGRSIDWRFNLLYQAKSDQINVDKTTSALAAPGEIADRSFSVFNHLSGEGSINSFPNGATSFTGVDFGYGALAGGFGGQFWVMNNDFNAQASKLVLNYRASDSPQSVKIEIKDGGDNLLYSTTVNMPATSVDKNIVINLPNQAQMAVARKVFLVIDQNATGDTSGNFRINSMNFFHLPSSQNFRENASLGAVDVTVVPNVPPAQLIASNPANNTLDRISTSLSRLNYDITGGNFSGVSINFDPTSTGASADLSALPKLVIGVNSTTVKTLKVEIDDASGNRAVLYIPNVDTTRSYYEFLSSLLTSSIDLAHVKRINFIVDQNSVLGGGEVGTLELELGGLEL